MNTLMDDLADQTRLSPIVVREILSRVFAHIHRRFYEGEPSAINGDYVGEGLRWDIGSEAYFHFLGMLVRLYEDYGVEEPGEWIEYAMRTFSPDESDRLDAQMRDWKPRER